MPNFASDEPGESNQARNLRRDSILFIVELFFERLKAVTGVG
jgi:hypothetical protein